MPVRTDYPAGDFCWLDLNSHDLEAAAAWYADVFGWKHVFMDTPGEGPPYAFFHTDQGTIGGIGQMSEEMKAAGIPPMWNTYVSSDDVRGAEGKVAGLGGQVTVPTMEVPGHGRLAFFMDPEGASIAVWESLADEPAAMVTGEEGAPCWNELMYRDGGKAHAFYSGLFGWEFAQVPMEGMNYEMVKNAGKDVAGAMPMEGAQFEGVPSHWMVYIQTADCAATADKIAASGGKVMVPAKEVGGAGKIAIVCDPQGAVFGLYQATSQTC